MPVVNCPIDIPEGWEFVRYGVPKQGEYFMDRGGEPVPVYHDFDSEWIVIRRSCPAIEVGDWVMTSKNGSTFYGVRGVIQKSRTDGDYLVQFGSRGAGWFCGDELIKQTRTIEPYTMGDLIAAINDRRESLEPRFTDDIHGKLECERQSRLIVFQGEKVIEEIYHTGIGGPFSEKQQFISYIEAAHVVTWPGGEAFGTVTWRDAE